MKKTAHSDKDNSNAIIFKIFIILALFIFFIIATDERVTTVNYPISAPSHLHIEDKHKNIKIALITDLHSCYYGYRQHQLIDILKEEQPDIILLGGDIYDDKLPKGNTDSFLSQLHRLRAKNHIYYVNGNHELWLPKEEYEKLEQRIQQFGIKILHGEKATIPNTNIVVWGVADPDSGLFDAQLQRVGMSAQAEHFNILLSHRPEEVRAYIQYPFDLIVSGHAHGGQWRIPTLINGLFAPNQGFLPKYAGGEYVFHEMGRVQHLIVSRGLARESTRFIPRVFNRPEIVFIDLQQQ